MTLRPLGVGAPARPYIPGATVSAPGNKRCRPLEALIDSGAFKEMTKPEQSYVVALDSFTNTETGLCYPSERTITERFGLSRSRQQEGRKRCLARNVFTVKMQKVNRKGNPVLHYLWQPEAWKSPSFPAREPRPNLGTTSTQFQSNLDPISNGGDSNKGGVHMGDPDPNRDGAPIPKPLINPIINSSAHHYRFLRESKEQEVARALRTGQNPKGREHSDEYWAQVRALKAQGLKGEEVNAALEKQGIK